MFRGKDGGERSHQRRLMVRRKMELNERSRKLQIRCWAHGDFSISASRITAILLILQVHQLEIDIDYLRTSGIMLAEIYRYRHLEGSICK